MFRRIEEFCPGGTQIAKPGGLSFQIFQIAAIEATEDAQDPYLKLHYIGGGQTKITFHRNVNGGPADIYQIKRNIEIASRGLLADS